MQTKTNTSLGRRVALWLLVFHTLLILGTPKDSISDGIADSGQVQNVADGVPYAWYIENGLAVSSALQDPDQDGLLNYQEYFYGTRPQVSEGFTVWISQS